MELGRIGIWARELRVGDEGTRREAAAELEGLGYGALWFPGSAGDDSLDCAEVLLGATTAVPVATGITNIWTEPADEVAAQQARIREAHGDRFLLGLGISHRPLVDRVTEQGRYDKPYSAMVAYLDELDAAPAPVAPSERIIAALGPRMLRLSAQRSRGTHPYLSNPAHTRAAREAVGPDALVAPELGVVLEPDLEAARALARGPIELYLGLPNYANNWLRHGFEQSDIADGGSDRLIDGLYALGDEEAIAARVREHLDAGADHVCLQVVHGGGDAPPLDAWRRLAEALL
jgi:probable F420-dependent oxidoreductase